MTITEIEEFFAGPDAIKYQPITPRDPPPPSVVIEQRYMTIEEAKRRFPYTPTPGQENE